MFSILVFVSDLTFLRLPLNSLSLGTGLVEYVCDSSLLLDPKRKLIMFPMLDAIYLPVVKEIDKDNESLTGNNKIAIINS